MILFRPIIIVLTLLAAAVVASGQTLSLEVLTDHDAYRLGETVHWTIVASTDDTTNQGVSLLGVTLQADQPITFAPAENNGLDLLNSDFDSANGFLLQSAGTVDPNAPAGTARLVEILVTQVGFDPNDTGIGHGGATTFAHGSFAASVEGAYTLSPSATAANYWNLDTSAAAEAFASFGLIDALLTVIDAQPGDANLDGFVDDADYTIWADNYLTGSPSWRAGDFNEDGAVDDADYTIWADNYGGGAPAPEPASAVLFMLGAAGVLPRRRR